jgi:hypothetical protein
VGSKVFEVVGSAGAGDNVGAGLLVGERGGRIAVIDFKNSV